MIDKGIIQSEPVQVAIGISKVCHADLIFAPGKEYRRRLTVLNQLADFTRLTATLLEYGRPDRVAIEPCFPEPSTVGSKRPIT